MKKYILLAAFAFVAMATAQAQTAEELQNQLDSIQLTEQEAMMAYQDSVQEAMLAELAYQDSIIAEEEYRRAVKDSILAVKNLEYAMEVLEVLADSKIPLDSLQYRPILLVDYEGNYYTTIGQNAIEFRHLSGYMTNSTGDQVQLTLNKGQAPEISFSNIRTNIYVSPTTIK
nr:hypothetical protein [uncultured Draconibacterium sp.]